MAPPRPSSRVLRSRSESVLDALTRRPCERHRVDQSAGAARRLHPPHPPFNVRCLARTPASTLEVSLPVSSVNACRRGRDDIVAARHAVSTTRCERPPRRLRASAAISRCSVEPRRRPDESGSGRSRAWCTARASIAFRLRGPRRRHARLDLAGAPCLSARHPAAHPSHGPGVATRSAVGSTPLQQASASSLGRSLVRRTISASPRSLPRSLHPSRFAGIENAVGPAADVSPHRRHSRAARSAAIHPLPGEPGSRHTL